MAGIQVDRVFESFVRQEECRCALFLVINNEAAILQRTSVKVTTEERYVRCSWCDKIGTSYKDRGLILCPGCSERLKASKK